MVVWVRLKEAKGSTDCESCKPLLGWLSLDSTVEGVDDGIESDPVVEVCSLPHSDRSLGNDPSPNELSPELITPLDPDPEF